MNKIFYAIFLLMLCISTFSAKAGSAHQYHGIPDTIVLNSGTTITCTVIQEKDGKILYKQADNAPTAYISTGQIRSVNYANGRKNSYYGGEKVLNATEQQDLVDKKKLCEQAKSDAQQNYSAIGPGFLTFFVTFLTGGIIGLIVAIMYSTNSPSDASMKLNELSDSQYKDCYRNQVFKMRKNTVWLSFLLGIGVLSFLAAILYL